MQALARLAEAVRTHLNEEDFELLELAGRRFDRETFTPEQYDQIFDRVLSRMRKQHAPQLERRYGLPS
jgi:hypothetical protein